MYLDPATGASEDFGYGSIGVKYTYVVELRDEGQYGFILPADQIQPVSEEMLEGMKEVGLQLLLEYWWLIRNHAQWFPERNLEEKKIIAWKFSLSYRIIKVWFKYMLRFQIIDRTNTRSLIRKGAKQLLSKSSYYTIILMFVN